MTKCLSPPPTAEPWEGMRVGKRSTLILVTFSGSTLLVDSEVWNGANLLVELKKKTVSRRKAWENV